MRSLDAARRWLPAALLLAAPTAMLPAAEASLAGCRAMADAGARLACYDALADGAAGAAGAVGSAAAPIPPRPTSAALAPSKPGAAGPTDPDAAARFGRAPALDRELRELKSTAAGAFTGWERGTRIRLANGQVWQVIDDSSASLDLRDPEVTVRRGALGSYRLEVEGSNQSARVRRVE